jgi:hypothetical protein
VSTYDNAGTLSVSGRRYQASTGRLKVAIDNAAAEAVHAEVSLMKGGEAIATNRAKIAPSGDSVILTGVSSPHGRIKVEQLKTARGPQAQGPIRAGAGGLRTSETDTDTDEPVSAYKTRTSQDAIASAIENEIGDGSEPDPDPGEEQLALLDGGGGERDQEDTTQGDTSDDTDASGGLDRRTLAIAGVAGLAGVAYLSGGWS